MARLIAACVAVLALAGCVPHRVEPGPTITQVETQTVTRSPASRAAPTVRPEPATTVAPLAPGGSPRRGETERACPYIASSPRYSGDTRPSAADIVGSHVLRTTVLTTLEPVGCRFYFYAPPYQAIADIVPRTYESPIAARAAMLAAADAGSDASGHPELVPDVDAVLFRTRFFGPDGARDWACAFTVGRTVVIVHTQRDDTSYSALQLAQAVAPKFA